MRNKFTQRGLILSMALLTLVFLAACGSSSKATMDEDAAATADATEASTNPPGVDRVESAVGSEHPSSAAGGAGNTTAGGTNTNLNTEATLTTETTTEVADTSMTTETTMEVETAPEPEVEVETSHTMTTKD